MDSTSSRLVSRRGVLVGAAALLAVAGLGGCASGEASAPVVIGSKGFAESWVMGELYAQALRAKGYTVDLKTNVGSSEIIDKALMSGQIDIYPEYTGVIVAALAGDTTIYPTAQKTYDFAKKWENDRGVYVGTMTPFENKNAIAVTKEFAQKHNLSKIEDLRNIGEFVYSTYPDNVDGGSGYNAIVKNYNLPNMKLKTLSIGLNYRAIEEGEIQAADVFTTDPQLLRSNLVVLTDTLKMFGFQNVVPLVRQKAMSKIGDDAIKTLNLINELLSLKAIQTLNSAVAVNRLDPAQVAKVFLQENKLL